jgi:hypothetical protein
MGVIMLSMDDARKWSLALARFNAFSSHLPEELDDAAVAQFHEIVRDLEEGSGEDLSRFHIPDSEMKRRVVSVGPLRARPRRPPTGGRQMSEKRYCDEQFMRRQLAGITFYLRSLQPPEHPRKIGF